MENFKVILILMVVVWGFGKIFRGIALPVIFGELVGGIVVGPLGLNLIDSHNEVVKILAELGVFFLMLHAGLETDSQKLLKSFKKSFLVAFGGVLLSFVGGFFVSQFFGHSFNESIFIGMCLSSTAIAISVRLFKDFKLQNTKVSHVALGAAFVSDIFVLVMFSVILNVTTTGEILFQHIFLLISKTVLFFTLLLFIGWKTSKYWPSIFREKGFTLTLILALVLGELAELVGLHAIVGAFLAGLFIRQEVFEPRVFNKIEDRIYGLSYSFLAPIFFASLAFYLDFSALQTAPWFTLAIILTAMLGKIIGAGGAALLQKMTFREAATIGIIMNSRGAVDLAIASIGISTGIISKDVFSILVIMAFSVTLVSTLTLRFAGEFILPQKKTWWQKLLGMKS